MKGTMVYVTSDDVLSETSGVKKKIDAQAAAFKDLGFDTTVTATGENQVIVMKEGSVIRSFKKYRLLPRRILTAVNTISYLKKNPVNLAYIRFSQATILTCCYYKKLKKYAKKLVVELPTYPFPNYTGIKGLIFKSEDWCKKHLKRYIDRIVYVGTKKDNIFGVPSVQIPNGISDAQMYGDRKFVPSKNIRLIAVSAMFPHHGYERIMNAMADYYKERGDREEVTLTLIGAGEEYGKYEQLIREYKLEKRVFLKGPLAGKALNQEYDNADIGIVSLNIDFCEEVSTLKTKEYLQRGIPFIYITPEIGLPENFPYAKRLSCGKYNPIDFNEAVEFAKRMKAGDSKVIENKMKGFARENYAWKSILENNLGDLINEV